jgi:tRNA(Ile)-lysidine synthase
MIDRVLDTIRKHNLIENGDKVVVGVSGGPDSVCLLHALHSLAAELNIELFAVHINHMLRGEEACEDERYVSSLCASLSIPLHSLSCNIRKLSEDRGISLEEAGREVRYLQFNLFADEIGADKIAVAHNKNDQAETVLMHIIRGTGLEGLKGMEFKRGRLIRPLLNIKREEIEGYCLSCGLTPRIDSSNLNDVYTRNKVRLDLLPYMEDLFGTSIVDSIYRMAVLAKNDSDFIDRTASEFFNEICISIEKGKVCLDAEKLGGLHSAIAGRVIRFAYREIAGNFKNLENVHVDSVISLAVSGRTGAEIHLPCGVHAVKSYNMLKIFNYSTNETAVPFDETVKIPGTTYIKGDGTSIEAVLERCISGIEEYCNVVYNSSVQFFDYDLLKQGINIRNRRDGDIFKPFKSTGTKKLKEFFIDGKISRETRSCIPLIAKENEIVWVIGYKISDKFKVTENTKNVLILKYGTA